MRITHHTDRYRLSAGRDQPDRGRDVIQENIDPVLGGWPDLHPVNRLHFQDGQDPPAGRTGLSAGTEAGELYRATACGIQAEGRATSASEERPLADRHLE
jgi:hypothetical protein